MSQYYIEISGVSVPFSRGAGFIEVVEENIRLSNCFVPSFCLILGRKRNEYQTNVMQTQNQANDE